MSKIPARRAAAALRNALTLEGVSPGDFYSLENLGWVQPSHMNSLELGIKPTDDGKLKWFVGVSGDGIVRFDEDNFHEGEHTPGNPEVMLPYFKKAFARLGLQVLDLGNDRWSPDTTDLGYVVTTPTPDWLEPYSPANKVVPEHDGALITAQIFDGSGFLRGAPAYLMKDGYVRIPRETVDALLALRSGGKPVCEGGVLPNGTLHVKRVQGPAASIYAGKEPVTDFWGNKVDAWEVPAHFVKVHTRFRPEVAYEVNGKPIAELAFEELDAQYGPAPWLEAPTTPTPGR